MKVFLHGKVKSGKLGQAAKFAGSPPIWTHCPMDGVIPFGSTTKTKYHPAGQIL